MNHANHPGRSNGRSPSGSPDALPFCAGGPARTTGLWSEPCSSAAPLVGGGHAIPKEIKGNAGRKPPEPSDSHSDIDDWFRRQMPHLQPIVQALDEAIRATIPSLHYAVKRTRPYYGLPELGWIIEIAAYDVSLN